MRLRMFFFAVAMAAIVLGSMQAALAGEAPKPKITLVEPPAAAQAQAEAHAMVRVDEPPASCCPPVYCAPFCCRPVYCAPVSCYRPRRWCYPIRRHGFRMRGCCWGF
jgi:hypothetical protein